MRKQRQLDGYKENSSTQIKDKLNRDKVRPFMRKPCVKDRSDLFQRSVPVEQVGTPNRLIYRIGLPLFGYVDVYIPAMTE